MLTRTAVRLSMLCVLLLAACSGIGQPTAAPKAGPATLAPEAMAQTILAPTVAPTLQVPTNLAPTQPVATQPAPTPAPAVQPTPPPVTATVEATPTVQATAGPQMPAIAHLAAGQAVTVTAIQMLDASTGWAVGHAGTDANDHILQTADGGKNWSDVTPPEPAVPPDPNLNSGKNAASFFASAKDAWAAYGFGTAAPVPPGATATVWSTHDGGQHWTASAPLKIADLEQYWPSNLVFVDGKAGWLMAHVGAGMSHDYVVIFATTDGGANWDKVVDPMALPDTGALAMSCTKTGLGFVDAKTGWVSGDCFGVVPGSPYLYQTNDGGHTWQKVELPPPADVPNLYTNENNACGSGAIVFPSATEGRLPVSCGFMDTNKQRGWLYVTADGGKTWAPRALPAAYGLLEFISAGEGWWAGNNTPQDTTVPRALYHTADGGQTWTAGRKLNWGGQLDFISGQAGWAIAVNGSAVALVQTGDGGNKWNLLTPRIGP
jgi:photosystem II stability/assembly factor-like uncharacterized protein